MRFDYEGAKEVLRTVRTAVLHPDIVTYAVLALGCCTKAESGELLQEIHANGIRMNLHILGVMLRQGCGSRSFPYVIDTLQIILNENIKTNETFLRHLHNFYNHCAHAIDTRVSKQFCFNISVFRFNNITASFYGVAFIQKWACKVLCETLHVVRRTKYRRLKTWESINKIKEQYKDDSKDCM